MNQKLIVTLQENPELKKTVNEKIADMSPKNNDGPVDPIELYNKDYVPDFYDQYLGANQSFLSAIMVEYLIVRSDLRYHYNEPLKIIDLGSGNGDTVSVLKELFLNRKTVVIATDAVDVFLKYFHEIDYYNSSIKINFASESFEFPFENDSIDLITSICAAGQYLTPEQFERLLDKVHQVLKPGGKFLIEFGNHTRAAGPDRNLIRFLQMIEKHGFKGESEIMFRMSSKVSGVLAPLWFEKI